MKYGKFICVASLMLAAAICTGLSAQRNVLQDVVYLKNGSIIRGLIVEQVPNESIKLQTNDGNIFVYNLDEVQKMTKEAGYAQRPAQRMRQRTNLEYVGSSTGYKGFLDVGYAFGVGNLPAGRIEILTSHGYQIVPDYLYVGAGIGTNIYVEGARTLASLPIFANLRSHLLQDRSITPFIDFKIGFAGFLGEDIYFNEGGLFLSPSIGVRFAISPRTGFNFSFGYAMQNIKGYDASDGTFFRLGSMSALNLKVGLDF